MATTNSAKRRKIFPTAAAASTVAVAFIASLLTQALGPQLTEFFAPLLIWWKWLLGSALGIVVIAAAWDRWRADDHDEPHAAHTTQTQTGDANAILGSGASGNTVVTGDKTEIHQHFYQPPTTDNRQPIRNRLRQITSPPKDFIGRKVELRELLADLETGAVISGVQGQGGIGKTALALKLAEALADKFTGAQIFLDLQGMSAQPVKTTSAMEHVIRSFFPESGQLPDTVAGLQPIYQSILQNELSEGRRVLLLFDNAKDRAQVEPLIPPAGNVMLVTSRAHFTLPGMKERNLEALQMGDAKALLTELCERCGAEAEELATLCGRLPMALRIVGSFLRERRDYPVPRYLEKLRAARLAELPEVAASLKLSCEQLPPELLARWHGLSVFADSFDLAAATAVLAIDAGEAQDALSELALYSLLDWDEAERRYSLHDLARVYADLRLADDEREKLKLTHAQHFCVVLTKACDLYLEGGKHVTEGLALFDLERANIEAGQAWAASRTDSVPASAELCVEYPNAGAYVLDLRQHSRERIRWLETQLAAARRLKRRDYEGAALGNLGLAYKDLGETHKAIEFYEQILVIHREIGDRHAEGADLGNLGLAYADLGETRKAIEFHEQALVIDREIGDRRGEGNDLWNTALALDTLGDREKAIANAEATLKIFEEIENPNAAKVRAQLAEWRS